MEHNSHNNQKLETTVRKLVNRSIPNPDPDPESNPGPDPEKTRSRLKSRSRSRFKKSIPIPIPIPNANPVRSLSPSFENRVFGLRLLAESVNGENVTFSRRNRVFRAQIWTYLDCTRASAKFLTFRGQNTQFERFWQVPWSK